jgi:hypothetical protein
MINALFVCTGNACRPRMAEAMSVSRDCSGKNHERGTDLNFRFEAGTDDGVDR